MENPCGYYDIEIDIEKALIDGGMVNDIFYLKDLKQRKLFLSEDVNQYSVGDIVKNILQYNREDYGVPSEGRKPILLYVSSNGGEVDAGFELIDAIRCSKTPVYTINLGYQYSIRSFCSMMVPILFIILGQKRKTKWNSIAKSRIALSNTYFPEVN